jgi:hypothetical protein
VAEPERLRRGKAFHRRVQRFYAYESTFLDEFRLFKANRRHGRADLFVWVDDKEDYAVIVEVKNTDWDDVDSRGNVIRNLSSHRRQLYSYLDGVIEAESPSGSRKIDLTDKERTLGIVYPRRPISSSLQGNYSGPCWDWEPGGSPNRRRRPSHGVHPALMGSQPVLEICGGT